MRQKKRIPIERKRPTLKDVLEKARSFIAGFEGDDAQEEPIEPLLEDLDYYMANEPEVFVYVEGGNIQAASATIPLIFTVFDKDNLENCTQEEEKEFIENNGTPEQWNEMIKTRTASGEIIPVY